MAQILDSLLIARPYPPGSGCTFSWTLVSRLGAMIKEVEDLFGPRNGAYTILGIEFSGETPRIWFPGGGKHIAVQLGEPAMEDAARAQFQLAHETVHLLDPVTEGTASVLEEGLATYYQLKYIRREYPEYTSGAAKYDNACSLASKLMTERPEAIRALRERGRTISSLTAQELRKVSVSLADREALILALPFAGWDGVVEQAPEAGGPQSALDIVRPRDA